ncbi:hypothetical protein BT69DRAFT_437570 [Atractiella rhizophila]|nr:hypothetical protein BT69DRAFT_437570 [Atractiella rhizophila]
MTSSADFPPDPSLSASPHRHTVALPLPLPHPPRDTLTTTTGDPPASASASLKKSFERLSGDEGQTHSRSSRRPGSGSGTRKMSAAQWPSLHSALETDSPRLTSHPNHERLSRRTTSLIHDPRVPNGVGGGGGMGASVRRRDRSPSPSPSQSLSSTFSQAGRLDPGHPVGFRVDLKDSPVKRAVKWKYKSGRGFKTCLVIGLECALLLRFVVGRGEWSGELLSSTSQRYIWVVVELRSLNRR